VSLQITDRDLGWRAIQESLDKADNIEIRVGILSGRPRYPDRGATPVAKVAGVHGVHKMIARYIDAHEGEIDERIVAGGKRILAGEDPAAVLESIAIWLRDGIRAEVEEAGIVERGYLLDTIRGVVYGGRKRIAGDSPGRAPQPIAGGA